MARASAGTSLRVRWRLCAVCGQEFRTYVTNRVTCSRPCLAAYRWPPVMAACVVCGSEFIQKRRDRPVQTCSRSCAVRRHWNGLTEQERKATQAGRRPMVKDPNGVAEKSRASAIDRGKGGYWTPERIVRWLQREADRLGRAPTVTDVLSVRRGRKRYLEAGWRPVAPSYDTIRKQFGTLAKAVAHVQR